MTPIIGLISALIFAVNTMVSSSVVFFFGLLKFLLPISSWQRFCSRSAAKVGEVWVRINTLGGDLLQKTEWDIQIEGNLDYSKSYFVLSNHQSWIDSPALQRTFIGKIPFMRVFIKHELLYVPFLGLAWWALDFPTVRRYSKEFLEKHPEKRGEDIERSKKLIERFQGMSMAVLSYAEGTRANPEKIEKVGSPYKNLLAPKAGGVATVMDMLGEEFEGVIDVTIYYPDGAKNLWTMFDRSLRKVVIRVRQMPVPRECIGDYPKMKTWLNQIWQEKDELLSQLKSEHEKKGATV